MIKTFIIVIILLRIIMFHKLKYVETTKFVFYLSRYVQARLLFQPETAYKHCLPLISLSKDLL